MTFNEKMTNLANSIRALNGTSGPLTLDAMTTKVVDTNTEITNTFTALAEKGIIIPEGSNIGDLAGLIENSEEIGGIDTTDATASADDILSGKTAYANGEKVTGTIATKTSSNLTASGATVTVPAGYYAANATKSVATATQATPSITVNASGLITASATQTAGYVVAGTKSATKQLTTKAAATYTPTTTNQTIASGQYLTGVQTIQGDANLVASNIKSGVSIFGVSGTAEVGGGGSSGDTSAEDGLVTKTLTSYTNDRVTTIGNYAFYDCVSITSVSFPSCTSIGESAFRSCTSLTTVSFPSCTSIGYYAFYGCTRLTTVSFPVCKNIGNNAFRFCTSLTTVSFPSCTSIGEYAFYSCSRLTIVSFPSCTSIGNHAFNGCSRLTGIYLGTSSICQLATSYAFSNTGIWSTKGSIFVPASLVNSYKTATNWTFFANRIFSIKDDGSSGYTDPS